MFFFLRLFMLLLCSLILISCGTLPSSSFVKNRDKEYLSAQSISPLKIPPGISSDAFQDKYPISDKNYSEKTKPISLVPPGLM